MIHNEYEVDVATGQRTFRGVGSRINEEKMAFTIQYVDTPHPIRRYAYPMPSQGVTNHYEFGFCNKRNQMEAELGPGSNLADARTRGRRMTYTGYKLDKEEFGSSAQSVGERWQGWDA